MNKGLGVVIWQIAVAAFLIAIGIMGFGKGGDLQAILGGIGEVFVIIAAVIALVAGVGLVLELFGAQIPILSTFIFIIAIIWAVFTVIMLINGLSNFSVELLRNLAVYAMVLGSLLGASGKFG